MIEESRVNVVRVKEAQAFPDLAIDFSTVTENLPAVIPQIVEPDAPVSTEPEQEPIADDTEVPDDIRQRLLYHWLLNGPDYAGTMVMEAPPLSPEETPVVIPYQVHHRHRHPRSSSPFNDGHRRMLRVRL